VDGRGAGRGQEDGDPAYVAPGTGASLVHPVTGDLETMSFLACSVELECFRV
jgi:hypothetical protein